MKAKREFQFYRHENDGRLMVVIEPGRSVNVDLAKRLGYLTIAEAEAADKKVPLR